MLDISIIRLDPDLPVPSYAHPGDAGADLYARTDAVLAPGGGRALVPTGLVLVLPDGYAGFVQPRSGLALRHGVTCLNTPGLIDAGYRNEIMVLLVNTDPAEAYTVRRGDRVAQLVIQRVEQVTFVAEGAASEVRAQRAPQADGASASSSGGDGCGAQPHESAASARGTAGFGSSGR